MLQISISEKARNIGISSLPGDLISTNTKRTEIENKRIGQKNLPGFQSVKLDSKLKEEDPEIKILTDLSNEKIHSNDFFIQKIKYYTNQKGGRFKIHQAYIFDQTHNNAYKHNSSI
ncbi:AVN_HP_G0119950.mRNA.1.CDS.1 [Saccharomyces cerevisiae]|nr:AVN_HP_G0119950.mRNA.1.CDS.1 [Saccharomyces cerevisiae]CAI6997052.1 AVN_HP_G0119950.mRNA.1.CDS.1 [Saccharomyces cerevisiae]